MILNMTTQEFSRLTTRELKQIFSEYLGSKVNEIQWGSMTNEKWGEYKIRHDVYAHSLIKVEPSKIGLTKLSIYNYIKKEWQDMPSC